MIMAYFNEDNVTEQMCITVAKETGLSPAVPSLSQALSQVLSQALTNREKELLNKIPT